MGQTKENKKAFSPLRHAKFSIDGGKAGTLFEDVPRPRAGFLIECANSGQHYYKKGLLFMLDIFGSIIIY